MGTIKDGHWLHLQVVGIRAFSDKDYRAFVRTKKSGGDNKVAILMASRKVLCFYCISFFKQNFYFNCWADHYLSLYF